MRCAARKRRERNEAEHEAAVMELVRDKFRTCEMRYGIVFFWSVVHLRHRTLVW